jgi:hypothetical protein
VSLIASLLFHGSATTDDERKIKIKTSQHKKKKTATVLPINFCGRPKSCGKKKTGYRREELYTGVLFYFENGRVLG